MSRRERLQRPTHVQPGGHAVGVRLRGAQVEVAPRPPGHQEPRLDLVFELGNEPERLVAQRPVLLHQGACHAAVSYTHLTLPTICSV
eukprot:15440705-Alexandrium_andersonii.AAC.1